MPHLDHLLGEDHQLDRHRVDHHQEALVQEDHLQEDHLQEQDLHEDHLHPLDLLEDLHQQELLQEEVHLQLDLVHQLEDLPEDLLLVVLQERQQEADRQEALRREVLLEPQRLADLQEVRRHEDHLSDLLDPDHLQVCLLVVPHLLWPEVPLVKACHLRDLLELFLEDLLHQVHRHEEDLLLKGLLLVHHLHQVPFHPK